MRILGIDPGVAIVGFGLIESDRGSLRMLQYGAITTPAGQPLAARLLQISRDMEELIDAFQPDEMSIEELFFSKNITTGIAVAHARGVILCAAEKKQLPIYEYTPMQVKQAVVGYGLAEKAGHGHDETAAEAKGRSPAGRCRRCPGHSPVPCPQRHQSPAAGNPRREGNRVRGRIACITM